MNRESVRPDAVAFLRGGAEESHLSGQLRFYQERSCVRVVADVSGLPADNESGFFALHIHEGGSCSGPEFAGTGGHYNPRNRAHPKHAGDLPPLLSCGGRAHLALRTDRFRVEEVLGKTAVLHSGPDDFHSQPAGNAGRKIACGVIRRG